MRLYQSTDLALIKRIVTAPSVYPMVTEDDAPAPSDYDPPFTEAITYLIVEENEEPVGLFALVQKNSIMVELHTCLMSACRGKDALKAVNQMIDYVWNNTPFSRIVTMVATFNRPALLFALKTGFSKYGLNPQSYVKDGVLWDTVMLGLTKPEETVKPCRS